MSAPAAPLLLALETSAPVPSVALLRGEAVLAELAGGTDGVAEGLIPVIERVLARADAHLEQVEAFAVSIGPGSFTGLRVGLATVKAFAFDPPRPVAPVSSLAALAAAVFPRQEPIAALLDARRGEVYAAVFPGDQEPPCTPLLEEGLFRPEELVARLPGPCAWLGDGVGLVASALRERFGECAPALAGAPEFPRAAEVGRLGVRLLARGQGLDAARIEPRYVRRAEAEARRTGRRVEERTPRVPL